MSSLHHPIAFFLRELIPLPDSVISKIALFTSHPIADIVRELDNIDYGGWDEFIKITIKSAKIPKNILEYNRVVFNRIRRENLESICINASSIGFIMTAQQIGRFETLSTFHNNIYCSRHPSHPTIVDSNPIVILGIELKKNTKRAWHIQLLCRCEAIKKNNVRCSYLKRDGTNYCGIHKNRI